MKIVIAGSRNIKLNIQQVANYVLTSGHPITTLICGMAEGVDLSAAIWAETMNIPIQKFMPDWNLYGKYAGMVRNTLMAKECDAALVIWDGESRGTGHMLDQLEMFDKPVILHVVQ